MSLLGTLVIALPVCVLTVFVVHRIEERMFERRILDRWERKQRTHDAASMDDDTWEEAHGNQALRGILLMLVLSLPFWALVYWAVTR